MRSDALLKHSGLLKAAASIGKMYPNIPPGLMAQDTPTTASTIATVTTPYAQDMARIGSALAAMTAPHKLLSDSMASSLTAMTAPYKLLNDSMASSLTAMTAPHKLLSDSMASSLTAMTAPYKLLNDSMASSLTAMTAPHKLLNDSMASSLAAMTAPYKLLNDSMASSLAAMTAPYKLLNDSMASSLAAMTAPYKLLNDSMASSLAAMTAPYKLLNDSMASSLAAMTAPYKLLNDSMASSLAAMTALIINPLKLLDLPAIFDRIADSQRYDHLQLAERGWFPDPSMPLLYPKKLAGQPDVIIDEEFSEWLRDQVDEIEASLATSHPGRARHLHQAFNAHRRCEYSLSILAFLTQADGIWHDRFSKAVFIGRERKNTYEQHGSQGTSRDRHFFLVRQLLPLWATATERDDSFDELNRHSVLHGTDIDYDTEKNSLKALSFLRWIDYMMHLPAGDSESDVAV